MKSKANYNLLTGFFKETVAVQILLAVVIVTSIWFLNWTLGLFPSSGNSQYASLVIQHENTRRVFEGEVVEGMTILDALGASSVAGKIELQYDYTDNGKTEIKKINGYTQDLRSVKFFLNNKEIKSEDIGITPIHPGDRVEIMFNR